MIAAPGVAAAALSVSPARVRLRAAASRTLSVTNAGGGVADVDVRAAGVAVDRRGRATIVPGRRQAAGWLRVRPRRLVLGPGATATVTVSSAAPAGALAGDHAALVVFTTKPPAVAAVGVRVRIGVVVFVRVAGRIVRGLEIHSVTVGRRVLAAEVANGGNVVERTRVRLSLWRGGRMLVRLASPGRTLLPHARELERFRRPGLRGWVTALVQVGVLRRTFRIRL